MGQLRPAGQIQPAGLFILARPHLRKLKPPAVNWAEHLFFLEIINGSDFQQNKLQRGKIGIKNEINEVKIFYFGDHIRTWTVISKKKVFTLFFKQRAARGFNSFTKSGPSCEKLVHPCSRKHIGQRTYKTKAFVFACNYFYRSNQWGVNLVMFPSGNSGWEIYR